MKKVSTPKINQTTSSLLNKEVIYELSVIIRPDLNNEAAEQKTRALASYITQINGEIKKEDILREIILAYPIRKFRRGFLWSCYFILKDPNNLKKLTFDLNIDSSILRHIIIKRLEVPKTQSELLLEQQTVKLMNNVVSNSSDASLGIEQSTKISQSTQKEKKLSKAIPQKDKKTTQPPKDTTEAKLKLDDIDKKIDEILSKEIE